MYRALELIDLTVADGKNRKRLKEILRIREVFLDFMIGENIYKVTDKEWEKYFYYFTVAARSSSIGGSVHYSVDNIITSSCNDNINWV